MTNSQNTIAKTRFEGASGRKRTIDALKSQKLVLGNADAAEELYERGKLAFFDPDQILMEEGDWGNDIFFILAGQIQISITGFVIGNREPGTHIGEMALIEPSQPRSATAVSTEVTVCFVVSEEDFSSVATNHPDMWRQVAKEVAARLRQRKKFIRPSNLVPHIFVACASESLPVAEAIKSSMDNSAAVLEIWTDGVFKPSQGTMESLEAKLETTDFAIAILSADDKVESRGQEQSAPRDNTIFELGLFAGAIGRTRSFFLIERDIDLKIPSDLAGITSLSFTWDENEVPDVSKSCAEIEQRILELGPR